MGLAQVIERPRNWSIETQSFFDALAVGDDGQFATFSGGQTNFNVNEENRSIMLPYDTVIHRMWIVFQTNALTGGSTNTFTLRANGVTTANAITITNADPVDTLQEVSGFSTLVLAGDVISGLWNSDSVGALTVTQIGITYRMVNPAI